MTAVTEPGAVCEAAYPWTGLDTEGGIAVEWLICGAPAGGQITGGCLHEHVRTIAVCAVHAVRMLTQPIGCLRCFEAGHECRMIHRVVLDPVSQETEKGV